MKSSLFSASLTFTKMLSDFKVQLDFSSLNDEGVQNRGQVAVRERNVNDGTDNLGNSTNTLLGDISKLLFNLPVAGTSNSAILVGLVGISAN